MGKLSTDLLTQCLNAGILFLLRWSVDDPTEQIYSAALLCLSKLLYVANDQVKYLFGRTNIALYLRIYLNWSVFHKSIMLPDS